MTILPSLWQKTLKFTHHLLALGWIGGVIVSLYIFHQLGSSADAVLQEQLNLLLFNLAYKLITPSFLGIIITSLLFALYTKYGFFRYYWIISKWILLVLAYTVFSFFYLPELHILAALADLGETTSQQMTLLYETAFTKAFALNYLNLVILVCVLLLSGFKPWGLRKGAKEHKPNPKLRLFIIAAFVIVTAFGIMGQIQMDKVRNLPVRSPDLSKMASDTYSGEYDYHYVYNVRVIIEDGIITEIDVLNNRDSIYAKLAEGVTNKILHEQRVDVDAVTGATTTSVAIQKAVENALMD